MSTVPGKSKKRGLAFKLALFILTSTTCIFFIAFGYNYCYSRKLVLKDVEENAKNLTRSTVNKIETMLRGVERAPTYLAYTLEKQKYSQRELLQHIEDLLITNSEIFGSTVAFEPFAFNNKSLYFAPYYCRHTHQLKLTYIGSEAYRYFYWDWYQIPKETNMPVWSEPYFDEGAGNIMMSTYSVPFYRHVNGKREFQGVVTADISLEWLVEILSRISVYQSGHAFLISQNGVFISHPNKDWVMRESIFSIAEATGAANLRRIGRCMISGSEGFDSQYSYYLGKKSWIYYAPLPSIGWSIGIIFPEDELYADIGKLDKIVLIIGGAGLAILFLVIIFISGNVTKSLRALTLKATEIAKGNLDIEVPITKSNDEVGELSRSFEEMKISLKEYINNLAKTTAAKERIESELKIAHNIQMSFLPKKFPPFPEKKEFEIYAVLEPAKEVGGDLYDFFLQDEDHLFISIGDVSDKGVPAALFMAVTKTLMKGIAEHGIKPSDVLMRVNRELCEENESLMFVTVFCGVLNLNTGEFLFSNAGHNPPVIIRSGEEANWLNIPEGYLLGVMEDAVYKTEKVMLNPNDTIFLYTDGVTEAFNKDEIAYSSKRLLRILDENKNPTAEGLAEKVMQSIKDFTEEEPQSDDITVLVLTFKGMLNQ